MVLMHDRAPVAAFSDFGAAMDALELVECVDDNFWLWPSVPDPIVSLTGESVLFESKDGNDAASVAVRGERRASGAAAPVALSLSGTKTH